MINPKKKKKDDGKWEYRHGSHLCLYIGAICPIHTDICSKKKKKKAPSNIEVDRCPTIAVGIKYWNNLIEYSWIHLE